jgi:hypothetical protein
MPVIRFRIFNKIILKIIDPGYILGGIDGQNEISVIQT